MPYNNFDPEHFVDEGHDPRDEEPRTDSTGDEPTETFYPAWNGDPETAPDNPDYDPDLPYDTATQRIKNARAKS